MIDNEAVAQIENLHRLKSEGIITEAEFEQSKQRILFGRGSKPVRPNDLGDRVAAIGKLPPYTGELPSRDDLIGWMTLPLRRYADFSGRSCRREFWMFQLLPLGLIVGGFLIAGSGGESVAVFVLGLIIVGSLLLVVPQLAVQVRRFHDLNRSGWHAALNLVPYVGPFLVLAFMLIEGNPYENRFGSDPQAD